MKGNHHQSRSIQPNRLDCTSRALGPSVDTQKVWISGIKNCDDVCCSYIHAMEETTQLAIWFSKSKHGNKLLLLPSQEIPWLEMRGIVAGVLHSPPVDLPPRKQFNEQHKRKHCHRQPMGQSCNWIWQTAPQ